MRILRHAFIGAALALLWTYPLQAQSSGRQNANLNGLSQCVFIPSQGMGTGSVEVAGTWAGTLSFTVSNTGDTYTAVNMAPPNSSSQVTTTTANGLWSGSIAGYRFFRACMTSYTSGAANVTLSTAATGGGGGGSASIDLSGAMFDGNAAASATGSAVPASADYMGINVGGTLTGLTAGQATMANSVPVTLASNQSALTVTLPTGAATAANQVTEQGYIDGLEALIGTTNTNTAAALTSTNFAAAFGTAGTADTQVLTVQGITSMTPILATLSGTNSIRLQDGSGNALTSIAAGSQRGLSVSVVDSSGNQISSFGGSGGTASAFAATFPSGASSGTAAGFNDGTNMQAARVADLDTGAGTFYGLTTNSVFRASGTPVEAGTSSNPWNVVFPSAQAVTGPLTDVQIRATPLPVSGTITGAGGTFPVTDSGGSLTVDAPVATPVFVRLSDGAAAITTLPVSIASMPSTAVTNAGTFAVQAAQSGTWTVQPGNTANTTAWLVTGTGGTFPSTQSGTWNITNISGTVSLPTGASTSANQTTIIGHVDGVETLIGTSNTSLALIDNLPNTLGSTTSGSSGALGLGAVTTSAPTYASGTNNALSLDTSGSLRVAVVSGSTGNAAASNTGAAVPTQADYAGINVAGTLRGQTGVNPSGSIYAGQVDLAAIAGATTSVNNGTADAGTQRVTIASNSTGTIGLAAASLSIGVEDAAETTGGNLNMVGTVRRDTATTSAGTTGDNATLNTDANGRLWTNPFGITQAAATYLTVRLSDGTNFLSPSADVTEDVASAGAETGPMVMGVRRDTAASSSGTAGDFSTFNLDSLGRLWTRPGSPCDDYARVQSVAINTNTAANNQLVALNGSDLIYICGLSVIADGATAVQFIYGTGTACATGETDITGPMGLTAGSGWALSNGGSTQFLPIPAGNAFCIENSNAVQISGHVAFVRTAAP